MVKTTLKEYLLENDLTLPTGSQLFLYCDYERDYVCWDIVPITTLATELYGTRQDIHHGRVVGYSQGRRVPVDSLDLPRIQEVSKLRAYLVNNTGTAEGNEQ